MLANLEDLSSEGDSCRNEDDSLDAWSYEIGQC